MIVGVDCRMLGAHGTARYLREILARLAQEQPDLDFVLAGNVAAATRLAEEAGVGPGRGRIVGFDAPIYSIREQAAGAWVFGRLQADVLFFPHFNVPIALKRRLVVTVHDTTHVRLAAAYGRFRARLARAVMGRAVTTARRVITSSQTTSRDLAQLFPGVDLKTVVAPGGVSRIFRPAAGAEVTQFRRRIGLPGPYVLSVGNRKPHKNLRTAAAAVVAARRQHPELSWVVIGNRFQARDSVDEATAELGGALRQAMGVSDDELRLYYAAATALLMPSRWEGFGLPVLEAMACGTPVIASTADALAEVAGSAAVLRQADDAPGFGEAISRLLTDADYKNRLSREGLQRAGTFSWERSAGLVAEALRDAAGDR